MTLKNVICLIACYWKYVIYNICGIKLVDFDLKFAYRNDEIGNITIPREHRETTDGLLVANHVGEARRSVLLDPVNKQDCQGFDNDPALV